jgi:hypothetical protein
VGKDAYVVIDKLAEKSVGAPTSTETIRGLIKPLEAHGKRIWGATD